jgi:predicted DNA-binding transcriptional regulator YafY
MLDESRSMRQLRLLHILGARHYGVTLRELTCEIGVTEKTIRRDLAEFSRHGFPLEKTAGDRGRITWKLTTGWGQPPLAFTFEEVVVLYLARRFLEPLAGTELWHAANSAMRKIRATLSKSALEYIERFPQLFHSTTAGFGNYEKKAEIIDDLTRAAEDRKAVHIAYKSQQATEPATRDVYPCCAAYEGEFRDHVGWRPIRCMRLKSLPYRIFCNAGLLPLVFEFCEQLEVYVPQAARKSNRRFVTGECSISIRMAGSTAKKVTDIP